VDSLVAACSRLEAVDLSHSVGAGDREAAARGPAPVSFTIDSSERKRKNLTGGSLLKFTKTPLIVRPG
jgi:hypothetical protein